jgi:hypothetical protein
MEPKMVKRDTAQIRSNWPWIKLLRSCTNTRELESSQMVLWISLPITFGFKLFWGLVMVFLDGFDCDLELV